MIWNVVLKGAESVIMRFAGSCEVKRFVVKLLDRYASSTDNSVDNMVVDLVKTKLLVNCPEK